MLTQKTCHKLIDLALKNLVQNQLHEQSRNAHANTVQTISVKEEIALITEAELKQKLKLSSPTLWRWRRKGMPYIKKGKKIFYEFNSVVIYMGGMRYDR